MFSIFCVNIALAIEEMYMRLTQDIDVVLAIFLFFILLSNVDKGVARMLQWRGSGSACWSRREYNSR